MAPRTIFEIIFTTPIALVARLLQLAGRFVPPEAIAVITQKLEQNRRNEKEQD